MNKASGTGAAPIDWTKATFGGAALTISVPGHSNVAFGFSGSLLEIAASGAVLTIGGFVAATGNFVFETND